MAASVSKTSGTRRFKKESNFQKAVIRFMRKHGWMIVHFGKSKVKGKWMTAAGADGKGFPDLLCVNEKNSEIWFIECKTDSGNVKPEQVKWMDALLSAGQLVTVLRPFGWNVEKERFV